MRYKLASNSEMAGRIPPNLILCCAAKFEHERLLGRHKILSFTSYIRRRSPGTSAVERLQTNSQLSWALLSLKMLSSPTQLECAFFWFVLVSFSCLFSPLLVAFLIRNCDIADIVGKSYTKAAGKESMRKSWFSQRFKIELRSSTAPSESTPASIREIWMSMR